MAKRPPAEPRAAPESSDQVMFLLGRLVEGQDAINKRMDEMTETQREQAQVQRQQAASLEELIQDNARQHAESAQMQAVQGEKLVALVEDFSDLKGEVRSLKEKVNNPAPKGPSEGRKENSFENAGKLAAFFKTYTPWFYALGVAIAGAAVAWLEHRSKGGTPSP